MTARFNATRQVQSYKLLTVSISMAYNYIYVGIDKYAYMRRNEQVYLVNQHLRCCFCCCWLLP